MNSILGVLIFVVTVVGIWFSYRLFMRGNTPEERVAAMLPPDFRPGQIGARRLAARESDLCERRTAPGTGAGNDARNHTPLDRDTHIRSFIPALPDLVSISPHEAGQVARPTGGYLQGDLTRKTDIEFDSCLVRGRFSG